MEFTIGQIDQLGKCLRDDKEISQQDLDTLQEYRKSYSEALPFIFESLRKIVVSQDNKALVTFRIKRIDTIINKLRRFKNKDGKGDMRLSRMWDIAGCRCILLSDDEKKIFKVAEELRASKDILERRSPYDHVTEPKPDGYRSYHMYVYRKEQEKPIEVQIRNKEMHSWATLVEIFDILYGLGIKEGNKANLQQQFLLLYSRKKNMTIEDGLKMIKIESKLQIFDDMCKMFSNNYTLVRRQWAVRRKGANYLVLEAGKGYPTYIEAFSSFNDAENCYYEKYLQRRNTNLVMVYSRSSDFKDISFAYSNYILSVHSFFFDYKRIIENCIIESVHANDTITILKLMKIYKRIILRYFECLHEEINALNNELRPNEAPAIYQLEWKMDLDKEIKNWQESVKIFLRKLKLSVAQMNNSRFHDGLFSIYFRILSHGIKKRMLR